MPIRRLLVCMTCFGLSACASAPLTAPPEAFLALGPVAEPINKAELSEGEQVINIEEDLEAWRKKFHENARLLRSLSWNCRVRYRMPGSFIIHVLYRANTDANGDVQVAEVDATEADQTLAGTLGAMARAYTFPLPGAMDRLLAAENLGAAEAGGGLVLRQTGFLMPEDAVELRLSPSIIEPQTFSFQAQHDGRAVEGKAKYRKLPDGTFYPATVDFILPDTQATVLVENFGFRMQPQMMRDTTE
jgi:hypothetical protein